MGKVEHAVENSGEGYAHLTPFELLDNEIRTERFESIPVSKIVLDAGIVDDGHVTNLADSMRGERGQISPITVRARSVSAEDIHHDVIDGFHRSYGLVSLKEQSADAIVLYGCDDEELFDLRVLAANSVRSVQYARVARWMQYSFDQTKWSEKGLMLSQIFTLTVMDSSGKKLGLTEEEAEEAKEWANEKAEIWNRPVATIWQTSRTLEAADPELVYQVRLGGGRKGKGVLTAARLGAIATPLAGEYELQQKVAEAVLLKNLPAKDAMRLAKAVAEAENESEVNKVLIRAEDFISEPSTGHVLRGTRKPMRNTEAVMQDVIEEVEKESELFISDDESDLQSDKQDEIETLNKEISTLKETLRKRHTKSLERLDRKGIFWWRTFSELTADERMVLTLAFDGGNGMELIADEMNLLPMNVIRFFISGVRKYSIYLYDFNIPEKKHRASGKKR